MKKNLSKILALITIITCLFSGCGKEKEILVVASPHPISFSSALIENFEYSTGIEVEILQMGTGEILAQLEKSDKPVFDVVWGGSYSTVSAFQHLFENYSSENEDMVSDVYKNVEGNMTRFSDIPSVIMINKKSLGTLEVSGYQDLLNPSLNGKIAMANPTRSSSAWEHLINMLHACGEMNPEKGWDYVEKFCNNLNGKLFQSSSDVYKSVASGECSVGLTFEEAAATYAKTDENIMIVYMEEGVVSTPDGIYIVKDSKNQEKSKLFVDYLTSKEAQSYMAKNLNRRSVRTDVPPPGYMKQKSEIKMIKVNYDSVVKNKEDWLTKFSQIFEKSKAG